MNKLLAAFTLALVPVLGFANTGPQLQSANIDLKDQASLQNGAKYYTSYCMGCHSLQYMRYNRMAKDLGIDDASLRKYFLVGDAKPGDLMTRAMRVDDAEKWFGVPSPDLTLVTRWRSPDWVYTYLKSYFVDPTRPWGVNNVMFPNVAMPNVLGDLQGQQKAVMSHQAGATPVAQGVAPLTAGTMKPEQFDAMVRDLTNFLTYAGEPMQLERQRLGVWVLIFLGVLFIFAYLLKKEFWKDVH
ncbi:cytochrome c1 [uncultured Thiodictyon sp.]|jgi:ubiquinol-cytochrome c reductase cytochrome c1 subunit|uniref:cytochrome c1 n=1 Tax=uncultured Thiodictyon sp. TaxID=1846217 RepID=UPI0025F01A16|nr:cytochrome c1 [uncultured Thiodictyon sp.]